MSCVTATPRRITASKTISRRRPMTAASADAAANGPPQPSTLAPRPQLCRTQRQLGARGRSPRASVSSSRLRVRHVRIRAARVGCLRAGTGRNFGTGKMPLGMWPPLGRVPSSLSPAPACFHGRDPPSVRQRIPILVAAGAEPCSGETDRRVGTRPAAARVTRGRRPVGQTRQVARYEVKDPRGRGINCI
jgi:hypothetical protein